MSAEEKKGTVLICDDDDLLREFYSRVLKTMGYPTVCATNGDDALTLMENPGGKIALAIIDLLMPVRTGWELIEYMKSRDNLKDIPIIAITGLATSFDEFEKVKKTCEAVLHKGDFDLAGFTATLKKLMGEQS
jgi:CheY-like chemotaxis protein